jgi:hypothetical protein
VIHGWRQRVAGDGKRGGNGEEAAEAGNRHGGKTAASKEFQRDAADRAGHGGGKMGRAQELSRDGEQVETEVGPVGSQREGSGVPEPLRVGRRETGNYSVQVLTQFGQNGFE